MSTKPVGSSAATPTETRHRSRRHNLVLLGVAAFVVAVDQLTKWWALEALDDRTIDLVWTLRLHLVHNTGAAFGVGQGLEAVIAVVALVFVIGVAWASWGGRRLPLPPVLLGMVLGGAIGNLADRAVRSGDGLLGGAVVDFIDLQWWPVFNAADSAIVVAGITLVLIAPRYRQPQAGDEPDNSAGHDDLDEPHESGGP
ncbi:MAG: signal peptidase II [bacterium]|nr:signal peptidase II [bacterium]